jgi:hypothetical protein
MIFFANIRIPPVIINLARKLGTFTAILIPISQNSTLIDGTYFLFFVLDVKRFSLVFIARFPALF